MIAIEVKALRHKNRSEPRRGWIVYRDGVRVGFVESDSYVGDRELRAAHDDAAILDVFKVTPSEFERIRKGRM